MAGEHGPDPRGKLAPGERLGHIIIGAKPEPDCPVDLVSLAAGAVSMITGTSDRWRRLVHTSLPGGPGSIRSSSTRSAPWRSKASSASGPGLLGR